MAGDEIEDAEWEEIPGNRGTFQRRLTHAGSTEHPSDSKAEAAASAQGAQPEPKNSFLRWWWGLHWLVRTAIVVATILLLVIRMNENSPASSPDSRSTDLAAATKAADDANSAAVEASKAAEDASKAAEESAKTDGQDGDFESSSAPEIRGTPVFAKGECDKRSGVTMDGETSSFACDNVAIVRSESGTVLIYFADKHQDDGRTLGFAGMFEGKQGFGAEQTQLMAVQRIYLSSSDPIPADRGTCILTWTGLVRTGGKLKSVICGGRGQAEGHDIKAMGVLDVARRP